MSVSPKAFGPSALATPANLLTGTRLIAAPIFAVAIAEVGHGTWTLFALWCVLAVSDGADGKLARWHGTTRSGAFLDPLADKFLVLSALFALATDHEVNWIAISLIAAREVWMSLFRVQVGRRGISVPARSSAKLKTLCQDLVVGFALAPIIGNHHRIVVSVTLWVAVVLTVFTGLEYLRDSRHRASGVAEDVSERRIDHEPSR